MSPAFFSGRDEPGRDAGDPPPLRPQPPLAKRLNRNALTVAAVIMGMTVLTAVVVLNSDRSSPSQAAPVAPVGVDPDRPSPARPSFLDQPARLPARADTTSRAVQDSATPTDVTLPDVRHDTPNPALAPPEPYAVMGGEADTLSPPAPPSPPPSPRERAYEAAVASPVAFTGATSRGTSAGVHGDTSLSDQEAGLLQLGDSIMRAAARPAAEPPAASALPSAVLAAPASNAERQRAFLADARSARPSATTAQVEPAGSPYTVRAGTVIPGLLLTAVSSELPGDVVGQVSRDVYDSRTQRVRLIPRGSRLVGTYDNQVAGGQGRLLVAWTRLVFPDGRSLRLPGLPLADPEGRAGAAGRVDNHWRRVFGNALLLSAIGAGAQLSQPRQASVLAAPSAGQVAAGALGQELSSVALEVLRRGMEVAPTIHLPQGQPFTVFLNGDLVFDDPYVETPPQAP